MLPTIEEDIRHVIKEFIAEVNPDFKPTRQDLENIKKILGKGGRVGHASEENGKMYTRLWVEVLKEHNVKDFRFVDKYEQWQIEELDRLKAKRKGNESDVKD